MSLGATLVLDGTMSLGTMLAMNSLAMGVFGPLSNLVSTALALQVARVIVEDIALKRLRDPGRDGVADAGRVLAAEIGILHRVEPHQQHAALGLDHLDLDSRR